MSWWKSKKTIPKPSDTSGIKRSESSEVTYSDRSPAKQHTFDASRPSAKHAVYEINFYDHATDKKHVVMDNFASKIDTALDEFRSIQGVRFIDAFGEKSEPMSGMLELVRDGFTIRTKTVGAVRDPATDQVAPKPNDKPYVQDVLIKHIEERKQFGINKYGTALQAGNGRDMVKDALEETLDLLVYLQGMIEEAQLMPPYVKALIDGYFTADNPVSLDFAGVEVPDEVVEYLLEWDENSI